MPFVTDEPGPHFLGIGAQKTGTSWLYHRLRQHPDVWMTPVKELNYFRYEGARPWGTYLFGPAKPSQAWRVRRHMRALIRSADLPTRRWYARYMLRRRTDRWYRSLFAPADGRLTGDISPGYGWMPPERIAHAAALLPQARILYLLRDPVEKLWSQLAMRVRKKHPGVHLDGLQEDELLALLNKSIFREDTAYVRNLTRWETHYPPDQVFVGFFDHLAADPTGFLVAVLTFLGLDASADSMPASVHKRENVGAYPAPPSRIVSHLARAYHDELLALHRRFANAYTAAWLEKAERAL